MELVMDAELLPVGLLGHTFAAVAGRLAAVAT